MQVNKSSKEFWRLYSSQKCKNLQREYCLENCEESVILLYLQATYLAWHSFRNTSRRQELIGSEKIIFYSRQNRMYNLHTCIASTCPINSPEVMEGFVQMGAAQPVALDLSQGSPNLGNDSCYKGNAHKPTQPL